MDSKLKPLSHEIVTNFYHSCADRFQCSWSKYPSAENINEEAISQYTSLYRSLGGAISPEKRMPMWYTYLDLDDHMILAKGITDERAYIGHHLLLCLGFDWDDGVFEGQTIQAIMKSSEKVIKEYFPEKFHAEVYTLWGKFYYCVALNRKYWIKEKIYKNMWDHYNIFRTSDVGVVAFFSSFAAIYDDMELLYIVAQEYVAVLISRCLAYVNNVFSFNKELLENELSNHLIKSIASTGLPLSSILRESLQEIDKDLKTLQALFPEYFNVFIFWIRGNLEWSIFTSRYY